jgi:hypothetical protein
MKFAKEANKMSFNLKTASSAVKKAAYLAGIRAGHWKTHGESIILYPKGGGREKCLNPADVDYAGQFTWDEIKRK